MTRQLVILGLCVTIYVVLSLAVQPLSFGMVQFRLGEMLMVLPFINKKYSISLIIGCLIVNLYSPLGIVDILFGTTSTALMCLFISRVKNNWTIPIIAGVLTGTMIGAELYFVLEIPMSLTIIMLSVGAGEVVTVSLGVIIFDIIKKKNDYFYKLIENI
ncbi:putative membrane protein [Bacilli bacterium PM5-3]|nr:putative membrane protein [Bacilli bacterium PM5-3]MDH6603452.1 putative membrane protein [Bacilli bacterium PM5-9]